MNGPRSTPLLVTNRWKTKRNELASICVAISKCTALLSHLLPRVTKKGSKKSIRRERLVCSLPMMGCFGTPNLLLHSTQISTTFLLLFALVVSLSWFPMYTGVPKFAVSDG